ncbi:unknown [Clostridium sp. CAG:226]|nr:unknown [Clostridium sp. CAG:226]
MEQFIVQNEVPPVICVAGFQASLGISGAAEWVSPCLRVNIVCAPAYAHEAVLAGASGFGKEVFGRTCPQFKLYKVRTESLFKLLLNYYALIFIVLVTTLVRYKHRNRECNALCAQFFHCLCLVFIGLISVIEVCVYAVKRWHISKVYAFIGIA